MGGGGPGPVSEGGEQHAVLLCPAAPAPRHCHTDTDTVSCEQGDPAEPGPGPGPGIVTCHAVVESTLVRGHTALCTVWAQRFIGKLDLSYSFLLCNKGFP